MIRLFLILFTVLIINVHLSTAQEIAITFDDAPMHNSPLFTNRERTEKIIWQLTKHNVQAAFYVITGNITDENKNQLTSYTQHGHLLANHSHSHHSPGRVSVDVYIDDIKKADAILKEIPGTVPWYRFPYLNEGATVSKRDSIRTTLKNLGLINGYVTVDNYDWFINGQLIQALREKKSVDYEQLKKVYLEHILNSVTFYHQVGTLALDHSPRHVLLLHENDLAALFLDDLLTLLKNRGWKIISPLQAYEDPIAAVEPDVLFNGQGRVAAIAFEKGIPAKQLVQESEDETFLSTILKSNNVFR